MTETKRIMQGTAKISIEGENVVFIVDDLTKWPHFNGRPILNFYLREYDEIGEKMFVNLIIQREGSKKNG